MIYITKDLNVKACDARLLSRMRFNVAKRVITSKGVSIKYDGGIAYTDDVTIVGDEDYRESIATDFRISDTLAQDELILTDGNDIVIIANSNSYIVMAFEPMVKLMTSASNDDIVYYVDHNKRIVCAGKKDSAALLEEVHSANA